jgi:plasmid stabilization system protein ParE
MDGFATRSPAFSSMPGFCIAVVELPSGGPSLRYQTRKDRRPALKKTPGVESSASRQFLCLPRDTSSMSFTPEEIATAYHEAGHAVMALALGRHVQRVSVLPNQQRLGHCEFKKGAFRPTKDALEAEVLILLGGLAAEARQTGEYGWEAASRDLRGVRELTELRAVTPRQVERLERRLLDKTEHLLDQPGVWSAVERIADELLRCTTLSGRAARHHSEEAAAQADAER